MKLHSFPVTGWLTVLFLLGLLAPGLAQDKSKYFTQMHPDRFTIDWVRFYNLADEWTARTRESLPHHLNLAFGSDPKQALDLYLPGNPVRNAAVFVFLHGGGFREGDRAHYGFVAEPLAANGIITAVVGYRLTTQDFHYPDQPNDVESAVAWLFQNVAAYGGNPRNLYLGGHSAGAILSAHVGVREDWLERHGLPAGIIRGIAPISGPYDLRIGAYEERAGEADAYVQKAEERPQASPIVVLKKAPPFAVVALGGVEEKYLASSRAFAEALEQRQCRVKFLSLAGMDHDQTALALADEKSVLVQAILGMIREGSR